jgi:hypothetical protein
MEKPEKDVLEASAILAEAVIAARAAGYRVTFQSSGGDPVPVLDGGPEPVQEVKPEPVPAPIPTTFGTRKREDSL